MAKHAQRILTQNELGNEIFFQGWIEEQSVELTVTGPNSHMQDTLTLQEAHELKLLLEELLDG